MRCTFYSISQTDIPDHKVDTILKSGGYLNDVEFVKHKAPSPLSNYVQGKL